MVAIWAKVVSCFYSAGFGPAVSLKYLKLHAFGFVHVEIVLSAYVPQNFSGLHRSLKTWFWAVAWVCCVRPDEGDLQVAMLGIALGALRIDVATLVVKCR